MGEMFRPKNDNEKWSRKNYFEIPPCAKPFLENHFYFIQRRIFAAIKMTFFAQRGISKMAKFCPLMNV